MWTTRCSTTTVSCADLQRHLEREVGHERQQRYWAIFEQLRAELGYADYLGALQHYRGSYPRDPHLLTVSQFLIDYPFANRLYPNSLDAVDYVRQFGKPVILSDGDVVFQPQKIRRSGLFDAVDGARSDLCPQGVRTGRRRAALSRRALRPGGRQAAHSHGGQDNLGRPRHHRFPAARPLRARRKTGQQFPAGGYHR